VETRYGYLQNVRLDKLEERVTLRKQRKFDIWTLAIIAFPSETQSH